MKKVLSIVLALSLVLGLAATSAFAEEKVLIVSLGGEPVTFNSCAISDDYAYQLAHSVFSALVVLNNNSEIVGDLAKDWTISEDNKTYTFHLWENVKWHDGEPFTAEDVKFTFEKIIANNGILAKDLAVIDSITCPDDNTLVIVTKEPTAPFLASLAWYGNTILPKHIYDTDEDWTSIPAATSHPIGTGPYKFVDYQTGVSITLEKNEDYFRGVPEVDRIVVTFNSDADSTYQAFLNGEIDFISNVPSSAVADLLANDNYSVGVLSAARRFQMCFNMDGEITSNLAVRQAVARSLDREEISLKGTNGLQAPAYGFYPPFLEWAYNDQVDIGEQDYEAAIKILEDAGFIRDDTGNFLHLSLLVFTGGTYADCARVIRSQLANVGIDVTIEVLEEGSWVERVFSKNYDLCILAGNQGPDPNNMSTRVGTGGSLNVSFYSNPEVDELLAQARVLTVNEERGALYKKVQEILSVDLPLVPLVEYAAFFACPANITGIPYVDTTANDIAPYNFCEVKIN